jgi:hypothetical protein
MFGALKITDDPISMKELQNLWRDMSRQNAALIALTDDGSARPRVVGVNMTYVCRIQDKFSPDDVSKITETGSFYRCQCP